MVLLIPDMSLYMVFNNNLIYEHKPLMYLLVLIKDLIYMKRILFQNNASEEMLHPKITSFSPWSWARPVFSYVRMSEYRVFKGPYQVD